MPLQLSETSGSASRKQSAQYDVDEEVDPREINKVLTEAAGMSGRWSIFRKFMHDRLKVNIPLFLCLLFPTHTYV